VNVPNHNKKPSYR